MDFGKLKNEPYAAFFHSGRTPGTRHLLAYGLEEEVDSLAAARAAKKRLYGYFGYNLRHELENYPTDAGTYIATKPINLMSFAHEEVVEGEIKLPKAGKIPKVASFSSNMTDEEYLDKVAYIIERIKAGDLYQANLTRKYFGTFEDEPDGFDIFCKLAEISPAPYSAYLKMGRTEVISASPEKFITMSGGKVVTIPIKGTLTSARPASELAASEKDRAENLMIVDLMRNDLARVCTDVKVEKLYEVTSYPQYHHMSSTITGRTDKSPVDVLCACFPPGSMTGAPKIAAVKLCTQLENWERGIYSGALGWIEPDACDLSVVIRTIIIRGKKFEFQVGGGIVADSVPEKEFQETRSKISGILEALDLK